MELREEKTKISDRIKTVAKRFFGTPHITSSYISPFGVPANKDTRELLQSYRNVVYQCITSIADDVSMIDHYGLIQRANDEWVRSNRVPILDLFENPNPEQTKQEFIEASESFKEAVGEVFWYFVLGEQTRKPKEVWIIRPDRVRIVLDKDNEIAGYKVRSKENPEGVFLMPEEMYHCKRFNPNDPFRGLGPLQAGLTYVQTEEFASEFTRNFLYNNATPSGIISIPGDVSKEAYDKFKRQWKQGVSGVKNAGSIATIRGAEAQFTKVGISLEDIDLEQLKNVTEDSIRRMFKVPKPLLGDYDATGLGRAGIESLEYIYMKRTIEPKMRKYDKDFEKLNERFFGEKIKIKHESVVPEDKEFELKRNMAAVRKWLSVDEVRELEGYDKVGDNQLYIGFNEMPVEGVDTEKKKSITGQKKTFKIKVAQSSESVKEEKPEPEVKDEPKFDVTDKSDNAPHEIFRRNTIEVTQVRYENRFRKEVIKFLDSQKSAVLDKFALKNYTKALEDGFDLAEETVEMSAELTPVMLELIREVGSQAVEFVGGTEYMTSEQLQKLLKEHILRMSRNFNEETAQKLSKTLAEGINNGESVSKLKKRVNNVYSEAKGFRNDRIARSESHWSATKATEDAYLQNGVKYKQWYANPGACQYCQSVDGTIVSVGQTFFKQGTPVEGVDGGQYSTDYEDIETSHLHPNCRCQLLPVMDQVGLAYDVKNPKSISLPQDIMKEEIAHDVNQEAHDHICEVGYSVEKEIEKKLDKKMKKFDSLMERLNKVLDEEENNQSEA